MNVTKSIQVSPVLTVHANYASGDFVGTSATPITFAGAGTAQLGTGTIVSAQLADGATQSVACELWIFDTTITPPNDSAAWDISDADNKHCKGVIAFGTTGVTPYYASSSNSISFAKGVGIAYKADASGNIYGCLVTRGTPTYASGDLTITLDIWQD